MKGRGDGRTEMNRVVTKKTDSEREVWFYIVLTLAIVFIMPVFEARIITPLHLHTSRCRDMHDGLVRGVKGIRNTGALGERT